MPAGRHIAACRCCVLTFVNVYMCGGTGVFMTATAWRSSHPSAPCSTQEQLQPTLGRSRGSSSPCAGLALADLCMNGEQSTPSMLQHRPCRRTKNGSPRSCTAHRAWCQRHPCTAKSHAARLPRPEWMPTQHAAESPEVQSHPCAS